MVFVYSPFVFHFLTHSSSPVTFKTQMLLFKLSFDISRTVLEKCISRIKFKPI